MEQWLKYIAVRSFYFPHLILQFWMHQKAYYYVASIQVQFKFALICPDGVDILDIKYLSLCWQDYCKYILSLNTCSRANTTNLV